MKDRKILDPDEWDVSKGVCCPKCHCPRSRVYMTRSRLGAVHRWRICDNCSNRYPTREVNIIKEQNL